MLSSSRHKLSTTRHLNTLESFVSLRILRVSPWLLVSAHPTVNPESTLINEIPLPRCIIFPDLPSSLATGAALRRGL